MPGEGLSPRPPVGPWAPVISVKLVPSNAGGDTQDRGLLVVVTFEMPHAVQDRTIDLTRPEENALVQYGNSHEASTCPARPCCPRAGGLVSDRHFFPADDDRNVYMAPLPDEVGAVRQAHQTCGAVELVGPKNPGDIAGRREVVQKGRRREIRRERSA